MENLKIRVANEAESKEAQELFFKLGYEWQGRDKEYLKCELNGFYILARINKEMSYCDVSEVDFNSKNNSYSFFKTITLQELRDMVNPMKEYLEKQENGSYKLVMRGIVGKDDDIEVPEGAVFATICGEFIAFWKDGAAFFVGSDKEWDFHYGLDLLRYMKVTEYNGSKIIWQRHTQPEELPFIDDEPKIETATGYQLDVVGKNTYGSRSRESGESDTSYRQYLMNFKINQSKSLNDQYAEIEQVRKQTVEATLAERQAQYGCFEDVARTTGKIMEALSEVRVNGLTDLPHTHRMALYMIASKMARIVNGDYNHKDSWHDIGGYSKLIEDLL